MQMLFTIYLFYIEMEYVDKDINKANQLLVKASNYNNDTAKFMLAYSYLHGENGFVKDINKAQELLIILKIKNILSETLLNYINEYWVILTSEDDTWKIMLLVWKPNQREGFTFVMSSKKDVNFTFIDAITPEENKENGYEIWIKNRKILWFNSHRNIMLFKSLGCFENGLDRKNNYISVFEDDIYLGESADLFLTDETWYLLI